MKDTQLFESVERELNRQRNNIELIASENFVSEEVLQLAGSVLTNKYAEGYPAKRYYGGCQFVDEVEELARQRICEIYGAEHANVQPHSGAQANTAVYLALLQHGDKVLGMSLADGGHLTHGHPLNFSGINYEFYSYGVSKETETIDYEAYKKQVEEIKPKLVVAGASAYSRIIDFEFMAKVAHDNGALFMVDMAHIAGLVAAGVHPSPFPYADIVTTTTHKTLRGPRGGVIMCKKEFAADIDRAVFPGMQGGPLMHIIAAKAQCFYEVQQPEFKEYAKQIIKNAKAMEKVFKEEGFRLVAGGTDNHLLLVDVKASCGISGKKAQRLLDEINITANKNAIPFDTEKPFKASGIRIGTPAMTTKGFKEEDFEEVARIIAYRLKNEEIRYKKENEKVLSKMAEDIYRLEHNLRYILMQVKINEENKKYDENIELIDQYIRNFGKFKAIINTDNPYFDYFMNQKINDLSSNGIDVHTSINISHSDYYLDREYVEYLIKMISMFKPKVTQITINVYEKQEFNIIEILTSKNIELKIDNSIKQLAQHLDAQYKNTQDDNICIFKSIQSMK